MVGGLVAVENKEIQYPKKAKIIMNSGAVIVCGESQAKDLYDFFVLQKRTLDKSTIMSCLGGGDKEFSVNLNYMEYIEYEF